MESKDGRYEIRMARSADHYIRSDTEWWVIELKTRRIVASFSGSFDGVDDLGTKEVSFTDDGKHLKIENYDKPDEVLPIETPDKPLP